MRLPITSPSSLIRGMVALASSCMFPRDKEIGHKVIDNARLFEERLDLKAVPFDAKKASGVRFCKDGCKIKGNQNAWPGYVKQQLDWALAMRQVIAELGL